MIERSLSCGLTLVGGSEKSDHIHTVDPSSLITVKRLERLVPPPQLTPVIGVRELIHRLRKNSHWQGSHQRSWQRGNPLSNHLPLRLGPAIQVGFLLPMPRIFRVVCLVVWIFAALRAILVLASSTLPPQLPVIMFHALLESALTL